MMDQSRRDSSREAGEVAIVASVSTTSTMSVASSPKADPYRHRRGAAASISLPKPSRRVRWFWSAHARQLRVPDHRSALERPRGTAPRPDDIQSKPSMIAGRRHSMKLPVSSDFVPPTTTRSFVAPGEERGCRHNRQDQSARRPRGLPELQRRVWNHQQSLGHSAAPPAVHRGGCDGIVDVEATNALLTLATSFSKTNSGVCTPITTSPRSLYFLAHSRT